MSDETQPTIELTVSVQPYDLSKGQVIDPITSSSKLTKADAGRTAGSSENWMNVTVESDGTNANVVVPKVTVNYHVIDTYSDTAKS